VPKLTERYPLVRTVTDLGGQHRRVYVLRSGLLVPIAGLDFAGMPGHEVADNERTRGQLLAEIWSSVLETYNEWVGSGNFTLTQLHTIRLLLIDQLSLREVARREGVTPAAISDRIESLREKAPKFYRWWIARHVIRRHAALNRTYAR
jgi:predicted DNA-binding protein YlxM (UPF0122 family)